MAASPRYEARAAVEELFREHRPSVYAICRSRLGDPGEAEDATQQVFLAAFRALGNGIVPRRPTAWLAAIARNECQARAQARQPVAAADELAESPEADPSTQVVTRDEVSTVWAAIAELPPNQREALLLREVRGLSYDELAEDMQLTRPSIRSLLARARHAMRARRGEGSAALGGASWLDWLARVLAGGSTPAAIATKTAVVGLGAAAITGGAMVAPELTPHPHRAGVTVQPRPVVVAHVRPKPKPPRKATPVVHARTAPPAVTHLAVAVRTPLVVHVRRHAEQEHVVTTSSGRGPSHEVEVSDDRESVHDSGSSEHSRGPGPNVVTPIVTPASAASQAVELDSKGEGGGDTSHGDSSGGSDHSGGSDGGGGGGD